MLALGELAWPLSRAVVLHKDAGERRLAPALARLLAEQVASEWPSWAPPDSIAFVPATQVALRRRGFDHAAALADALALAIGAPVERALVRGAAADQRALSRTARARNVAGSLEARAPVRGSVLLVDDVMTTGATLDAAAAVLLAAGADRVRCAVVARAW